MVDEQADMDYPGGSRDLQERQHAALDRMIEQGKRIAELEAEVKRLRGAEYGVGYARGARDESAESAKLSGALADRVAELEAENQRLRDEASEAADIGVHLGMHKAGERERVLKDRIEELEVELEEAIEGRDAASRTADGAIGDLLRFCEANRWIPVEERLPKLGQEVLFRRWDREDEGPDDWEYSGVFVDSSEWFVVHFHPNKDPEIHSSDDVHSWRLRPEGTGA